MVGASERHRSSVVYGGLARTSHYQERDRPGPTIDSVEWSLEFAERGYPIHIFDGFRWNMDLTCFLVSRSIGLVARGLVWVVRLDEWLVGIGRGHEHGYKRRRMKVV